jgi:peptidoglycan/LPS O-acetylase OafA/YrhL
MSPEPMPPGPAPGPGGGAVAPLVLWQLDAVRGAAACYIACAHLLRDPLEGLIPGVRILFGFGQEAVIAFFLLSGFVIHWSVAHKPGLRFGAYLRARAVRIYPLLVLTLLVAALVARGQNPPDVRASWPTFLGNLLMLQDAGFVKPGVWVETYAGVLALWSLSYEWWFYMLYFPLGTKLPPGAQARVVAAISLSQALVYLWWPNQASRFLLYFCIWWAGVEFARAKIARQPPNLPALAVPVGTIALVALVLVCDAWRWHAAGHPLSLGTHPILELRHFVAALAIIGAVLLWRRVHWAGFKLFFGGFARIAPWSYALYLLHEPLGVHAHWLDFVSNLPLRAGLDILLVFLLAWLAERYVQSWSRRVFLP